MQMKALWIAVWHSKFSNAPCDAREWARQARFLQGRGFSSDIIRKLLKNIAAMSNELEEHDD